MKKGHEGISGWLLVFLIGIALSVILGAFGIISITTILIKAGLLFNLFSIVLIFMNLVPLILLSINGILILQKKKKAIKFTIFILIFNFVWYLIDLGFLIILQSNALTGLWPITFAVNLIWTIVWIAYFKKSKRVKNTLIR